MTQGNKNVGWVSDSVTQQNQNAHDKNFSCVPAGWTIAQIGDVAEKAIQRIPAEDEEFIYVDIGCIDRSLKQIREPQKLLGKDAPSRARKVINTGDVLVSLTRPNLNAVALVGDELDDQIASTGFEVIKPISVDSRFIFSIVRSNQFIEAISKKVQGALYPAAKSYDVRQYEFLLPPLAEQHQIAAKLDELLAQVDSIKTCLDAIPNILKRFRQSVLSAAVRGKLTEDWRLNNLVSLDFKNLELKLLKERELHGFKLFKELDLIDDSRGPYDIPNNWKWVKLGQISLKITDGAHNTPKVFDTGFPYLMAKDLTGGKLDFSENRFISEQDHRELYNKCQPQIGDLLVVNIGAGTGNNVLINVEFEFSFKNMAIIKRPDFVVPNYLKYFFDARKEMIFQEQARGGAQPFLSLKLLNNIDFALPPKEEQVVIVRRVEQLFTYADQIEQRVKDAQTRVNHLTQSILAKAFRGELTADWRAQNPDLISGENSAEALLAKIQAQRLKEKPKTGRKARA